MIIWRQDDEHKWPRSYMLLENIWFEYSEKGKVMTDKQTNKQTEFPIIDSTSSMEGVE